MAIIKMLPILILEYIINQFLATEPPFMLSHKLTNLIYDGLEIFVIYSLYICLFIEPLLSFGQYFYIHKQVWF